MIERPLPYVIMADHRLEMLSNNRDVKLILVRNVSLSGGVEHVSYVMYIYVRDSVGWERASTIYSYPSIDACIEELSGVSDFSQAYAEIRNDKVLGR